MKLDFAGEAVPQDKRDFFEDLLRAHWTAEHIKHAIVDVKNYSKTGERHKCSVSIEAMTDYGQLNIDASHWNFETCLRKGVDKLEKQVRKHKGRATDKKGKKSWRKKFWPRFRT